MIIRQLYILTLSFLTFGCENNKAVDKSNNDDTLAVGELEIVKLHTVNKIISGRFWFDCVEIHSGELVRIRDGRFDVQYTIDF